MVRTAGAALATVSVVLLCGQALSDDRVRLPRKGSSPGLEMRYDQPRHVPRQGNHAGPSREERDERDAREERRAREKRREPREHEARLEGLERHESKAAHCVRVARSARLAQEEARQKIVVGYLAGGLVGALIASSQNGDAYKEPKVLWGEVYDNCMGKRRPANGRRNGDDYDD